MCVCVCVCVFSSSCQSHDYKLYAFRKELKDEA